LSPGEQASLDQIESGLRDDESDSRYAINAPTPKQADPVAGEQGGRPGFARDDWAGANKYANKAGQAQKAASFMSKNKKWIFGGATGLGILIPIVAFFAWMMLFKNVHIKNLYVTYRWAQFNRGMSKALKAQLKYAKETPGANANGGADSTISPTDAPDDTIKKANAEELGPDKLDPDDTTKIEAEAKKVTSLEQSVEGASDKTLRESGAGRSVAAAEGTGDTPEEKSKSAKEKAKTNVDDELSRPGGDNAPDAPDSVRDAVDEAKRAEEGGKPPAQAAAEASDKFLSRQGLAGAAQKIQGVGALVTFYCLFRDIYVSAKDQINKIIIGGAVSTSQQVNKTADCQKKGNCDTNQIAAVAEKFDDGEKSFTETCGYARATQSSNPDCEEINPQFAVNGLAERVGGAGEETIKVADTILDPPKVFGFDAIGDTCGFVNGTAGQVTLTLIGGGGFLLSGASWQTAGQALASGATQFAGTAGGKALIAHTIMTYGGSLYKDLSPFDMGNLTDMGNMATASGSCATAWCPQVSDVQAAKLDQEYRTERIAANSKRSVFEKFFDTQSPDSISSRVVLNAPATPKAAIGRIKTVFASISNPIRLNIALGKNSLALVKPQSAYAAADNGAVAYGLSGKVTVPPNLLTDTSYADIISWGKSRDLSSLESKYKKCGGDESESFDAKVGSDDRTCFWDNLDDDGKMFFQYKYAQNVAYKTALVYNKQTNISGAADGAVGGAVSGAASAANPERNTDTSDPAKYPCPAGTTRSVQPAKAGASASAQEFKVGLCDIGNMTVNASAAQAFLDMKNAAAADGIILGGGGYRSYTEQISLRIAHGCGGANLYNRACKGSPPTAVPGRSMHEVGLAVDFKMNSGVFQWLKANAGRFGIFNLPSESWHWSTTGG
jgi:hypothetical protein